MIALNRPALSLALNQDDNLGTTKNRKVRYSVKLVFPSWTFQILKVIHFVLLQDGTGGPEPFHYLFFIFPWRNLDRIGRIP